MADADKQNTNGVRIYHIRDLENHPVCTVAVARNATFPDKVDRATAFCSLLDWPPKIERGKEIAVGRLRGYWAQATLREQHYPWQYIWTMLSVCKFRKSVREWADRLLVTKYNGIGLNPTDFERRFLGMEKPAYTITTNEGADHGNQ